jgi:hypothetical protein
VLSRTVYRLSGFRQSPFCKAAGFFSSLFFFSGMQDGKWDHLACLGCWDGHGHARSSSTVMQKLCTNAERTALETRRTRFCPSTTGMHTLAHHFKQCWDFGRGRWQEGKNRRGGSQTNYYSTRRARMDIEQHVCTGTSSSWAM